MNPTPESWQQVTLQANQRSNKNIVDKNGFKLFELKIFSQTRSEFWLSNKDEPFIADPLFPKMRTLVIFQSLKNKLVCLTAHVRP